MCELFGCNAAQSISGQDLLREFFSHSVHHPNGWGLAIFQNGKAYIEKEPIQASKSAYLKKRLERKIEGRTILAHIRYATIGNIEQENCHPFLRQDNFGRNWVLVHNGTIFNYPPLASYQYTQLGQTDSERILWYLVDQINLHQQKLDRPLKIEERCRLLDELIGNMAPGNKLNLLIYDGQVLYAHTNAAHSLYMKEKNDTIFLATVPLDQEEWLPHPFTCVCAYQNGQKIYQGKPHHAEYVENPTEMQYLFQAYSAL